MWVGKFLWRENPYFSSKACLCRELKPVRSLAQSYGFTKQRSSKPGPAAWCRADRKRRQLLFYDSSDNSAHYHTINDAFNAILYHQSACYTTNLLLGFNLHQLRDRKSFYSLDTSIPGNPTLFFCWPCLLPLSFILGWVLKKRKDEITPSTLYSDICNCLYWLPLLHDLHGGIASKRQ